MSDDHRKLYQKVAQQIVESIEKGKYSRGGRLPSERDLAEEMRVSRPTIREAMIALEILGLVEARHGSGIYVVETPPVDSRETELDVGPFELTEARRLFEGEAVALAATTITTEELAVLEELALKIAENRNEAVGERADRDFHLAIAEATRNSVIASVIENLWDLRYKSPLSANMFERARQAGIEQPVDDHWVILEALKTRDPKAAREAMHAHLDHVIDGVLDFTEMDAIERTRSEIAAKREKIRQHFERSQPTRRRAVITEA